MCADGELRSAGGSEGIESSSPGSEGSVLSLYGQITHGRFVGGGRLRDGSSDIARVRLVWPDGQELIDEVENGIVLFAGARKSLEPAGVEFLDPGGRVVGRESVFADDG